MDPNLAYNLSGGTLDATALAANTGAARLLNIGSDGLGTMIVGGNANPATLQINPTTPGALAVTGNVTLTGANAVVFSVAPTTTGTITVLTYSGTLTGTPGTGLVLANSGNYRTATWTDTGSAITLSPSNQNLSWSTPSAGTWDVGATSNWTDGSPSTFYRGDNVTFPDIAANTAISIAGGEVTPASMNFTANTSACTVTAVTGTAQVETATAAGAATADGTIQVTVTAGDLPGSPLVIPVAVTTGQAATAWAGTARTALNANTAITSLYTVGGSSANITLTRKADAAGRLPANDTTLNIALDKGSPSPGITIAPTAPIQRPASAPRRLTRSAVTTSTTEASTCNPVRSPSMSPTGVPRPTW